MPIVSYYLLNFEYSLENKKLQQDVICNLLIFIYYLITFLFFLHKIYQYRAKLRYTFININKISNTKPKLYNNISYFVSFHNKFKFYPLKFKINISYR